MAPAPKAALTRPAAVSGRKRKAPEVASSSEIPEIPVEIKDAERKYDLDADILECQICLEPFSPPVYQCQSGHSVCSTCHSKIHQCPSCSQPIDTFIRNLLAEKIVEFLKHHCPYAHHGCKQQLKFCDVEEHVKSLCAYRPCPCPVSGCVHNFPKQTLALHLQKDHKEAIEGVGDILFCTCFEDQSMSYDLKVLVVQDVYGDFYKPYTMINNAIAAGIRQRNDWKKDLLLCSHPHKLTGVDSVLEICIPGGSIHL